MERIIYLKMTVNWDDYNDVCDELILDDSGIFDGLKNGVSVELLDVQEAVDDVNRRRFK